MITVTNNSVQQINAALLSVNSDINGQLQSINQSIDSLNNKTSSLEGTSKKTSDFIENDLKLADVAYTGDYNDLKNIPDPTHEYTTNAQAVGKFGNYTVYEKSFNGTKPGGSSYSYIGRILDSGVPNKVLSITGTLWWKIPADTDPANINYRIITREYLSTEGSNLYLTVPNNSGQTYEYFITIRYC